MLEKDGENQLERSCEKRRSVTYSLGGKIGRKDGRKDRSEVKTRMEM